MPQKYPEKHPLDDDFEAATPHPARRHGTRRVSGAQFSVMTLLLVMFVVGVVASGGYYAAQYFRSSQEVSGSGRHSQFAFILFTLASPVLVTIGLSGLLALRRQLRRRRHRR